MVEVKEMVALADLAREMMVAALGKVHMQVDMIAQVQDMNDVNGLDLSNLVSKIGKDVHTESGSHATMIESDQCYDRNMVVHYNQKNVEEVQEPYLHLPEANFSTLP